MISRKDLHQKIAERFGPVIDQRRAPDVFERLVDDISELLQQGSASGDAPSQPPFGVSWMDSWVAHWIYAENLRSLESRNAELATVLRGLADLKFNQRLNEIKRFLQDGRLEPPDGGTPEPGTPPAGPTRFIDTPPDGGTPEPGVPPGPEPPGPQPSPGPDVIPGRDNPWILYWFVSIRTPMLLDVIDAHLTRRLNELRGPAR